MILRQPYFLHKRIFSDEELTKISSIGEALEPQQAKTFNGNARKNYRDSHISWIENTQDTKWIYKKLIDAMTTVNQGAGWNFQHSVMEKLQYTRYSETQHYNWHSDQKENPYTKDEVSMVELHGLIRKISFSVLLNDDYEGGEFEFEYGLPDSDNRIKTISPQKGLTILFPSFIMHRVKPVINGERRSLVGWVCGKPWV